MKTKPRYKAHYGKSQPVADDVMVEVVLRNGHKHAGYSANRWYWVSYGNPGDIIAYRILEDEQ